MARNAAGKYKPWAIAGGPDPDFADADREMHHAALTDPDLLERFRQRFPADPDADYEVVVRRLRHVWDCPRDEAANVTGFRCVVCGCTRSEAGQLPKRERAVMQACGDLGPWDRRDVIGDRRAGALSLRVVDDAGRRIIVLRGELDAVSTLRVRRALQEAARSASRRVELDLRGLTFLDCAGLSSILEAVPALGERLSIHPGPPRVQRVIALLGLATTLPFVEAPAAIERASGGSAKLTYVRRLCEAFAEQGVDALVELVPHDVEWIPQIAAGRVLRGSDQLRAFMAERAGPPAVSRPTGIHAAGDHVLVRFEAPAAALDPLVLWSLYQFHHGRLVRAISFDREADALRAAA
jgi:anti-sigma B factor antagonist